MIAESIYLLCIATSACAAFLLLRAHRASRVPLLFWSGLCFVGLALNNVVLFVDLVMLALVSLLLLLFGLIWGEA
jgi:hypothetical protein